MRLAYVCLDPGVPVFGRKGCSVHCQEVIRALRNRGYEVEVFATRLGKDIPADLQDVPTHRLVKKLDRDPVAREQMLMDLNSVVEASLKVANLSEAGPFDMVYERYSLWSFAAMEFAKHEGIPGVLEVNSPLIDEQLNYRSLINEAEARRASDQCFRHASSVITVSDQVAEKIFDNYPVRSKTTTIPNGVNCQKFSTTSTAKTGDAEAVSIGFVGTLKPWHGVSILLEAFSAVHAENPNVSLTIVGDGPEKEALQQQLRAFTESAQQAITMVGAIPHAEIPRAVSGFDIAVAPYPAISDFYFSPLKILEYMASGRSVVASRIGQINDLVQHDVTGCLVEPGCPEDLAKTLLGLVKDPDTRSSLGSAASQYVRANHSWRGVVDQILTTTDPFPISCEGV